jgi:hypothetical protein
MPRKAASAALAQESLSAQTRRQERKQLRDECMAVANEDPVDLAAVETCKARIKGLKQLATGTADQFLAELARDFKIALGNKLPKTAAKSARPSTKAVRLNQAQELTDQAFHEAKQGNEVVLKAASPGVHQSIEVPIDKNTNSAQTAQIVQAALNNNVDVRFELVHKPQYKLPEPSIYDVLGMDKYGNLQDKSRREIQIIKREVLGQLHPDRKPSDDAKYKAASAFFDMLLASPKKPSPTKLLMKQTSPLSSEESSQDEPIFQQQKNIGMGNEDGTSSIPFYESLGKGTPSQRQSEPSDYSYTAGIFFGVVAFMIVLFTVGRFGAFNRVQTDSAGNSIVDAQGNQQYEIDWLKVSIAAIALVVGFLIGLIFGNDVGRFFKNLFNNLSQ